MFNSALFIIMTLISLSFILMAFKLGKHYLIAMIAILTILANIFVLKGMYLFGLAATGGNVIYASIFLGTDLLSEYYGKKTARQAVWVGFFASMFFLITSQFIIRFNPAEYDFAQGALETLFTLAPRIVLGSMLAYLISQNLDVWLFNKIKNKTGERMLWLRNNASTWISQLVDSTIFHLIAFWGIFPNLWQLILFVYIVKIIVATLDTPFIYLSRLTKPNDLTT